VCVCVYIIYAIMPGSSELLLWLSNKSWYAFLISSKHATCPNHLSVLDLIIVIIFGEVYRL
jgi:hypothetical protein